MSVTLSKDLELIRNVVANGGPEPESFNTLDSWFRSVASRIATGVLSTYDLGLLRMEFGDTLSLATLQGFVYQRPHGYAGDFEIMDRIYLNYVTPNRHFSAWDRYFQSRSAPKAVRNRKLYFHHLLDFHSARARPLRVLKLAIGPGRSMFEWFSRHPEADVRIHCVELDPLAIAYAKALNQDFLDKISFEQANAIEFRPAQKYDLIWAAGLFDYFSDTAFKYVFRRLLPALDRNGELAIGNFSPLNPTRAWMDFCDWRLEYRSAEDLAALATACGVGEDRIRIGQESESVNLFLHIAGSRL